MAERLKDKEDLKLESMFRSDPLPDAGFSVAVVSRVRRHMWIRRLSMPVAIGLGLLVSAKPLMGLASVVPGLVNSLFGNAISVDQLPVGNLPQLSTMLFGATLLMAVMLASKILEE
jgi:hypothetical protein